MRDEDESLRVDRFGDADARDNALERASLERQEQTDPLTGLSSRRAFHEELDARLTDGSPPFALLLLDLGDLERVRDLHGHAAADEMLVGVARTVERAVRVGDRVCRVGGDELAIIAPRTDDADAHELAGRVTEAVASMQSDEVRRVAVSFGVALGPEDGTTPAELFAAAERAIVADTSRRTAQVAQSGRGDGIVGLGRLARELAGCNDPESTQSALVVGAARVLGAERASLWLPGASARPVCAALWRLRADGPCWRVGDHLPRSITRASEDTGFATFTRAALGDVGIPPQLQSETTLVGTFRFGGERGVVVVEFETSAPGDDAVPHLRAIAAIAELAFVAVARAERSPRVPQATLDALVTRIETTDEYSSSRRIRMRALAGSVGRELELDAPQLQRLQLAAVFHDIGMTGVPESIRMKPGPLTDEERAQVERHPAIAEEILAPIARLARVGAVVRACHERYDGSGYPDGLEGEAIPVEARIVAVCNAYLAMTTASPYRYSLPPAEAIRRLREGAGTHFDPVVLDACCRVLARTAAQDA